MNHVISFKIAVLLVVLVTVSGCKAKQEKSAENATAPQSKSATTPASPAPGKAAAQPAAPQDMADARACALRVLSQLQAGDFTTIYRESGAGFKQIGPEAAFVAKFQQTLQKTGALKNPRELKFDTRPNNVHVLVYRVENQRFITDMRLSLARSKSGAMELVGLNQHDEPRKQ